MNNIQCIQKGKAKFIRNHKNTIFFIFYFFMLSCSVNKENLIFYYDIRGDVDSYIILNTSLKKFTYEKYVPVRDEIISYQGIYKIISDTVFLKPLYIFNYEQNSSQVDSFICAYEYYGKESKCVNQYVFVNKGGNLKNITLSYWFPQDDSSGCFENETFTFSRVKLRLGLEEKKIIKERNTNKDYFYRIKNLK